MLSVILNKEYDLTTQILEKQVTREHLNSDIHLIVFRLLLMEHCFINGSVFY